MLGTSATITPARGIPIAPRTPAPPTQPSAFAVGSATQIPPAPATPPVIAPLNVRFVQPTAPQRLPQGTKPIENDVKRDDAWKRQARDAFIRGVVYALLIVIVATTIYLLR
jgi:hypothetical protein